MGTRVAALLPFPLPCLGRPLERVLPSDTCNILALIFTGELMRFNFYPTQPVPGSPHSALPGPLA